MNEKKLTLKWLLKGECVVQFQTSSSCSAQPGTNSFQQMSANFTHFTAVKNFQKTSENFLLQLFSLK